ncbi:L-serine ammonia-lyase, iron-sulfur-dependent, subunit alpha [Cloacibacillus evryensis]|uniref:L-serine ammonia-lyase, iron-sulfur-dependent, subunit alpha n=1 Tax=Cloacibacillus evryensis TaxID=508460 RepID=UPI002588A0E0|nr:L-serine ammonia-lyase, iron-sulfur-dependent, subunit alpha [Cloacibacillus evryensis]
MDKMPASIFNDVIGPVMRGPSSSHVAGAARIAAVVRQSVGGDPLRAVVDFDVNGSLAASHDGHGTDMGFVCGMLGKEITEPDVDRYARLAREAGVEIEFRILDYGAEHPNNYRIEAWGRGGERHLWEGVSVGGGMIEMRNYDGFPVSICGDFCEALVKFPRGGAAAMKGSPLVAGSAPDFAQVVEGGNGSLLSLKYSKAPDIEALRAAAAVQGALDFVFVKPMLPTLSRANCSVPFSSARDMLAFSEGGNMPMWELAAEYEAARGGTSKDEALDKMRMLVSIMEGSLKEGLAGTEYADRILGPQARLIEAARERGALIPCDILNNVIKSITAIMETKSAMGVIVAAPTAGSCGCLPGTLLGAGLALGKPKEEITRAMLAAGLIGIFIAEGATFAAEVGGCQVECGSGSGMAAAGLVQLMGGSAEQCVDAASMALQNITGLACDPVANRVEVPCLGKNVMGGSNAVASANMALAGYDKVIPLDETIAAMYDVGLKLPLELRCTFGGLGKSPAALKLLEKLKDR